eukprot:gene29556-39182_t
MTRAVETPASKIFSFCDYKNNGNKENSLFTGSGAPSRPLFAVTTPYSKNSFKGFRGEGIISGGLSGQPKAVPSQPLTGVNPFVSSIVNNNPFQSLAEQPPKALAVPVKPLFAVTPTSANPFRSSFTGQPDNGAFCYHGICPESSAATPAITVSNPLPAPVQASNSSAKSYSTIDWVGSGFPQRGISVGVSGKSIQPTIFIADPAKAGVSPSVQPVAVPFLSNGLQQSSSSLTKAVNTGFESAVHKNSLITAQPPHFQYVPAMTVPVPVPVIPAPAPLATNPGANTIAITSNSPAVCGPVRPQPQPQQEVVLVESKSLPQDISHKIECLMNKYEELISSPHDTTYSKPAEAPKELVVVDSGVADASATFRGFSGSSVHFLPDKFTHRASTARVVPRGMRVASDSHPPPMPLPSRTVKPLNSYSLESLSSPDLLYLGRNAKNIVIVPQSAVHQHKVKDDDNTDITAGLPARNALTRTMMRATPFRVSTVPAAEDSVTANPPSLTLEGYWTSPDMSILKNLSDSELSKVANFAICRNNYGKIEWDGITDVRGLDLDKLVRIDKREVFVYGDDRDDNSNSGVHAPPPVGTALNKGAMITLWEMFPKSSSRRGGERESDDGKKLEERLRKFCTANDADHISYSVATGEWVFAVKHF